MWGAPVARLAAFVSAIALAPAAAAGPPYVTDDPETTDTGHWEIYNFAVGVETPGEVFAQAGLDLNYGAAKDLQLTAVIPVDFTAEGRLENDRLSVLLPVWAEKDWGKWSLFGGGGYVINPGRDNRNYWQSGIALTRAVSDRLSLGAEIYHQTPASVQDRPFTGLNAGADYKLTDHWSLLAAGGPGIQNARHEGQADFYLALEAQY